MSAGGRKTDSDAAATKKELRETIEESCYENLSHALLNEESWSNQTELATGSRMTAEAHQNRTVLELVQNARDAIRKGRSDDNGQREGSVAVVVGPETLYVANTGQRFRLDEEEILNRVRRLGKGKADNETIGEKGVGMRSIMALGNRFGIHSAVSEEASEEHLSVDFTAAHAWAMLARRYLEVIQADSTDLQERIAEELGEDETFEGYVRYLEAMVDRIDSEGADHPLLRDSNGWPDAGDIVGESPSNRPPSPRKVLADLPELSPFRYPVVRDETDDDAILNTLLGREGSNISTSENLTDHVSEERYTTVVTVDYTDEAWNSLLEDAIGAEADGDSDIELPVEEWRKKRTSEIGDEQRNEAIWEECEETITAEVLILLEEVENVDLVRITDEESVPCESYHYEISNGECSTVAGSDLMKSQQVTVHPETRTESEPDPESESESEFELYTKAWSSSSAEEDEENLLKILYERPQPNKGMSLDPQPLHLYYPIEDENTPFPFIVHAPFEVQMDRQNLDSDHQRNKELLMDGILQEFVLETVKDILDGESELRDWLPWLVMPLRATESSSTETSRRRQDAVSTFVEELCDELEAAPCVPTFGGAEAAPGQVLLEVADSNLGAFDSEFRLEAFEPVREYLKKSGEWSHDRLPEKAVVENGRVWLSAARKQGRLPGDQLRTAAARIGVSTLLDKHPGDDASGGGDDNLVSVLDQIWGTGADTGGNEEVAVEINDPEPVCKYFETLTQRLTGDESTAAIELGKRQIPVIPALDYSGQESDSSKEITEGSGIEEIGHLVRAKNRNSDSGINRTVFYEDSSETDRRIGPPPSTFDVFLVPYVESWYGALDDNAEEWDTTKFDGDTDIYRRVASELGGYPNREEQRPKNEDKALEYLYKGYVETARREETSAELFNPLPYQGLHYHTDFSVSVDTNGIGDLLEGKKFNAIEDENFLRERYIDYIRLPTAGSESKPAAEISFGQDWVEEFRLVAEALEDERVDDAFEENRLSDAARADDFRRWAMAVDLAEEFRAEEAPTLASPEKIRSKLGPHPTTEREGPEAPPDEYWLLNFLLHLGVQVGPRIEWAWLDPANRRQQGRRPRTLLYEEAKSLSDGDFPNTDEAELPFSPESQLLGRYADVCRRARNHPAFAVGHADDCGGNAEQRTAEWSVYEGAHDNTSRLAIPMWWRFVDVPSEADLETARAFRNAILLIWPELSDRLFPVGWACAGAFGNSHQVKSPKSQIPSLGLVQLRQTSIWPPKSDEGIQTSRDLVGATELGYENTQNLPQLDYASLTASINDEAIEIETLAPEDEIRRELGIGTETSGPAAAAERIDSLLERFDGKRYRSFRNDAFRLLREFNDGTHLDRLSEAELMRQWKRRDIFYTGTQVFVNRGGTPDPQPLGDGRDADVDIYNESLPEFAREQLEGQKEPFVELPTRNPGPIANVLADGAEDHIKFGIHLEDQPDRPVAMGDIDERPPDDLRKELDDRVADLAAAYAAELRGDSEEEEVKDIERQLDRAVKEMYVVSPDEVAGQYGDANSVGWAPDEENAEDPVGIALLEGAVDGDFEPHHAVDALVHIVDNEDVRDKFEVVLRAAPPMNRYKDIRGEYDLGERKKRALTDLLGEVLPALLSVFTEESRESFADTFSVPDDEEEVKSRHEALRAFAADGQRSETIREYVTELGREVPSESQAEAGLQAGIQLAFQEDHRGTLATLIDEFIAEEIITTAGLQEFAESVDTIDLTDWQSLREPSLQRYLTAVAVAEEFYSRIDADSSEDDLEDASNAAISNENKFQPSPFDTVAEVLPESICEDKDLDRRPVIIFGLHNELETVSVPTDPDSGTASSLQDAVIEWAEDCHYELEDAVGSSSIQDFLEQPLYECLGSDTPLRSVKRALKTREQATAKQNKRTRKKKARAYDKGQREYATEMASSSSDVGRLEFPPVGGSRPVQASASEVAGDGRDGELACIQAAWEQFDDAGPQQAAIIKEIRDWRKYSDSDQWRMKSIETVFEDVEKFGGGGDFDFGMFRDRMCDEDEDTDDRKRWFRLLIDTSEESGPGFDYIDPFGTHYGPDADAKEWEPDWMRRVEVKSIDGTPEGGYRVTLTGNEFRMARRTYGDTDKRRYLVRLVFGHRSDDGEFDPTQIRDIENVIQRYGSNGESAQKTAWDALRGGRVPLSGEFD